jgi:hypothetical protein
MRYKEEKIPENPKLGTVFTPKNPQVHYGKILLKKGDKILGMLTAYSDKMDGQIAARDFIGADLVMGEEVEIFVEEELWLEFRYLKMEEGHCDWVVTKKETKQCKTAEGRVYYTNGPVLNEGGIVRYTDVLIEYD